MAHVSANELDLMTPPLKYIFFYLNTHSHFEIHQVNSFLETIIYIIYTSCKVAWVKSWGSEVNTLPSVSLDISTPT